MKSYGQAGQDLWVHDLIGDTGYYVDVGAHDGLVHSNTYALEQLGWDGICIEPNSEVFWNNLWIARSAQMFNYVVSDHDGAVPFNGVHVGVGRTFPCRTLRTILREAEAPDTIDYLSIDVEGHELEVLAGMDFDRWHVRLITIEHNLYCDGPARKDAIAAIMTGHGFECYADDIVAPGYGEYESWWIHNVD